MQSADKDEHAPSHRPQRLWVVGLAGIGEHRPLLGLVGSAAAPGAGGTLGVAAVGAPGAITCQALGAVGAPGDGGDAPPGGEPALLVERHDRA